MEPWAEYRLRRLPGLNPLPVDEWLLRDDAFDLQMAYRDHLISTRRSQVFKCLGEAGTGARELLDEILAALSLDSGYQVGSGRVVRPDGIIVRLDEDHPLVIAGRLVQQDWCLMAEPDAGGEHWLAGAVLCFPASWLLEEKIGLPLTSIHIPVDSYTDRIARGVQRVFDVLQEGRILYRANYLKYSDPDLFQPRSMNNRRDRSRIADRMWLRIERQTLRKLNKSGCVAFGIHTIVCPRESVADWDRIWQEHDER